MMAGSRDGVLSALALVGALPAAMLPWVLANRIVPIYVEAGAALPALTQWWLRFWPVSLLLPFAVLLLWWRLAGHPRRGAITAMAGAAAAGVVDGFSVVVLWLPVMNLPDLVE